MMFTCAAFSRVCAMAFLLAAPDFASAASSTEWPMFRGNPALTGVTAATLPDKPKLAWTFKTGGPIQGSPVIAGGRIYITSMDRCVYALKTDGSKLWEFKSEGPIEASPCVVGDTVFAGSGDRRLYALDASTGKERWSYETQGEIKGSPNFSDGKILVGSYDNKLHCVDAATGKKIWTFDTGNYINGAPGISGDIVAFGGCDGMLHAVSIKDGKEVSSVNANNPIAASVALAGDIAYFGHYGNEVMAADFKKEEVVWTFRNPHEFAFFSSPAVTDKYVIIGGRDKRVHCLDRATGKESWLFTTRGNVDSSPVVAGEGPHPVAGNYERILVGSDDGRIYMLSMKGEELWTYEIGSPVDSSAAVIGGLFLFGASDGVLYAFGP